MVSTQRQKNHVTLILGIARLGAQKFNSAVLIGPNGNIISIYDKHHLLPGLENQFIASKQFFNTQDLVNWGVAICKDMDFLEMGRYYGQAKIQVIFVPALDFNIDAWYHGRSAMMRGLENGFTVVRAGAHGYLSISDPLGRIIVAEADFYQKNNLVIRTIPIYHIETIYSRFGDWFAYLVLLLLIAGIVKLYLFPKRE